MPGDETTHLKVLLITLYVTAELYCRVLLQQGHQLIQLINTAGMKTKHERKNRIFVNVHSCTLITLEKYVQCIYIRNGNANTLVFEQDPTFATNLPS